MAAKDRRANVTVEFALIAVFLLLPLLASGADFVAVIAGQAQVNTALQAIDYFAYTNPASASNVTYAGNIISAINAASIYKIALPINISSGTTNGASSYCCFTGTDGSSTTITYQTATYASGSTQLTLVTYQVTTSVVLPFPLPSPLCQSVSA